MIEFTISISDDGAHRLLGTIGRRRAELADKAYKRIEDGTRYSEYEFISMSELNHVYDTIVTAIERAGKPLNKQSEKQPPVDRGKLMIALEICRGKSITCGKNCPYYKRKIFNCLIVENALSYICYLEEQLKDARDGT